MNNRIGRASHRDPTKSKDLEGSLLVSDLPTAKRTQQRVLQAWLIGLFVFGFLPAVTYGWFTWLLNAEQWRRVWIMYLTAVPIIGGIGVIILPMYWMRPIFSSLKSWENGQPVTRQQCARVYELCLRVPRWIVVSALASSFFGYAFGGTFLYFTMHQPLIELIKLIPAVLLVGGLSGGYCFFGTTAALYPIVVWCSRKMERVRFISKIPLDVKFLSVTYVLVVSVLCMVHPSAFTLGQVINESHLKERTLFHLQVAHQRFLLADWLDPERSASEQPELYNILKEAELGDNGYVFAVDDDNKIVSQHKYGFKHLAEEKFSYEANPTPGTQGVFVSRIDKHRIVAYQYWPELDWKVVSVVYADDFQTALHNYLQFSLIPIVVVLLIVMLFGNYYVKGMTSPLLDMTQVAQSIAEREDFDVYVPISTNDEVGEMAASFNWMIRQLKTSHLNIKRSNKHLELSAKQLSSLNQEMEDLLHAVSHDLRAPLINIQGFSKRLQKVTRDLIDGMHDAAKDSTDEVLLSEMNALSEKLEPRMDESMTYITKGIEKMDMLLTQLLAMSRIGKKSDPYVKNDLNRIVDDVLDNFNHQLVEERVNIVRQELPEEVYCRANEINQVFANLVSNAIKYMGESDPRIIEIGGDIIEADQEVECYVKDSGVGIEDTNLDRVFQTFTRLQRVDVPGEGVGLAYVRKVLRSHQGRIWVESAIGQGSKFVFRIPVNPPIIEGEDV